MALEKVLMFEWAELARRKQDNPFIACEAIKKLHEELDKDIGFVDPFAKMAIDSEYGRLAQLSKNHQPLSLSNSFAEGINRYVSEYYMPKFEDCSVSEVLELAEKKGYKAADNVAEGLKPYLGTKYKDIKSTVKDYEDKMIALEVLKRTPDFEAEYNSAKAKLDGDERANEKYKEAKKAVTAIEAISDSKFEKMYVDMTLDSLYPKEKKAETEGDEAESGEDEE